MQAAGEISHLAGSGRVIVRLLKRVEEGQVLCDEKGTRIARVMELIGPVDGPYASASPLTNNVRRLAGRKIFAPEPAPRHKRSGRGGKR